MLKHIHTGTILGKPLRFFAPPAGGPDFPWHCHNDLMAALEFATGQEDAALNRLREFPDGTWRTQVVDGAIVVLAPHYIAQGFLGAMEDVGHPNPSRALEASKQYDREGSRALNALTASMPAAQSFAYVIAAAKHNMGGAA